MADWTQTVSNTLEFFGSGPSSKWGVMVWGTDKWAEGSQDMPHEIAHLYGTDLTLDDPFAFDWPMNTANTLDLDSAVSNETDRLVENTLSVDSDASREELSDGSGYYYVFTGPTINSDVRNNTEWDDVTDPSETWTSASVSSTDWTEQ